MTELTAEDIIARLDLAPHPEGGHFRQTWIAGAEDGTRPAGTCIYFLLGPGEKSHWHAVDATEIWHFYAGTPLVLSVSATKQGPRQDILLGPDLLNGETPQAIVPEGHWQAARAGAGWALVGCTVSPGFRFEGFELAPPDFDIP